MANGDFVGLDITGLEAVSSILSQLPAEAADGGVELANEYLVDALHEYPPYSHVPISAVGGFVSDKQRRKVMAMIRSGEITPGQSNRTQRLAQGWQVMGTGANQIVINEVPYGVYEYDPSQQTQMHMLQGWQIMPEFLQNRMDQIIRKFSAGVKNAISKLGLE